MKDSKPVTELARLIKGRDMLFLDVHRGAMSSLTKGANPEVRSSEGQQQMRELWNLEGKSA